MSMISFKLTPAEKRLLRARARAESLSVSSYLRRAALGTLGPAGPRRRVIRRHPVSGLRYDASPGRPVSAEEIRAALADFP
jgi:hypothetical protein